MVSEVAAIRAEGKVSHAIASGARVLAGHKRNGRTYLPTVIEEAQQTDASWQEEAFAPIVVLEAFEDVEDAIVLANSVGYGIHTGILTTDISRALTTARRLEAAE